MRFRPLGPSSLPQPDQWPHAAVSAHPHPHNAYSGVIRVPPSNAECNIQQARSASNMTNSAPTAVFYAHALCVKLNKPARSTRQTAGARDSARHLRRAAQPPLQTTVMAAAVQRFPWKKTIPGVVRRLHRCCGGARVEASGGALAGGTAASSVLRQVLQVRTQEPVVPSIEPACTSGKERGWQAQALCSVRRKPVAHQPAASFRASHGFVAAGTEQRTTLCFLSIQRWTTPPGLPGLLGQCEVGAGEYTRRRCRRSLRERMQTLCWM
jgi:hypothetical protein